MYRARLKDGKLSSYSLPGYVMTMLQAHVHKLHKLETYASWVSQTGAFENGAQRAGCLHTGLLKTGAFVQYIKITSYERLAKLLTNRGRPTAAALLVADAIVSGKNGPNTIHTGECFIVVSTERTKLQRLDEQTTLSGDNCRKVHGSTSSSVINICPLTGQTDNTCHALTGPK